MNIEEMEKRLELMCKLASYNQKIREDYDKGINTILDGTQRVIDFMTKNSKDESQSSLIKDVAIGALSQSLPNEIKIATKGIGMIKEAFFEPKEPVNPIDEMVKIEPEKPDTSFLESVFKAVSDLRLQINESDIDLKQKYNFERSIYDIQKMIWNKIKSS